MRPRRTPGSTGVLSLEGGNEDTDLWYRSTSFGETHVFASVWEFTPEERRAVAAGANVQLAVFGPGHPPVDVAVTHEALGRGDRS